MNVDTHRNSEFEALLHSISTIFTTARPLSRVLTSLEDGIGVCHEYIETFGKDSKYIDSVVEQECSIMESLLGAAFVACQAEITVIVSLVMLLHRHAVEAGHPLSSLDGGKSGILAIGGMPVAQSNYSHVAVIDAFANYFKHRSEWTGEWTNLSRKDQKQTAEVIKAVGATEESTANLLMGANAIGTKGYSNFNILADRIAEWARAIVKVYRTELINVGLLGDQHIAKAS